MAKKIFRVLCIDGGGMRGIYTAAYIDALITRFAAQRKVAGLDFGKAFDLIVGTSTGAIVASGLAAGIQPERLCNLYKQYGAKIFPAKMPNSIGLSLAIYLASQRNNLASGSNALKQALTEQFGDRTLGQIYRERGIALAVPAVEMSNHASWVFKTPHLQGTTHRDDNYRLVEVCLATSAAPVFRSLASIKNPDHIGSRVFCDGGLWANTPILVGLLDALQMTDEDDQIEIYSLGTCPRPSGEQILDSDIDRTAVQWKFGGEAIALSLDAQEFAIPHMVRLLLPHIKRSCKLIRFPGDKVPATIMPYLDLDETRSKAMDALISQAHTDVNLTTSHCADPENEQGQILKALMYHVPTISP